MAMPKWVRNPWRSNVDAKLTTLSMQLEAVRKSLFDRQTAILAALGRIEAALAQPSTRRVGFNVVALVPRDPKPGGGTPMLEISCDTESKARIRVVPKTKSGAPASIQSGSLAVTTQSGAAVATLEDDVTFTILDDTLEDSTLLVSGDADLGDGVETISDTILFHSTSAKAANLGLTQVEIVPR